MTDERIAQIRALLLVSDAHVGGEIDADDVRALLREIDRLHQYRELLVTAILHAYTPTA